MQSKEHQAVDALRYKDVVSEMLTLRDEEQLGAKT